MRSQVLGAVEDDLDLLGELFRLHQRQDLEHLVERPEAARKDHQRLCQIREPELPHEEIVELEVQPLRDVAVRPLLEGQFDVQAHGFAARLLGAAVGGLHDARAAAGRDDEAMVRRGELARPDGQQLRQFARFLVIPRPLHGLPSSDDAFIGLRHGRSREAMHQLCKRRLSVLAAVDAGRAEEHDGVLDVLRAEATQRFQIFGEDAERPAFFAVEEITIEIRERLHSAIIEAQCIGLQAGHA